MQSDTKKKTEKQKHFYSLVFLCKIVGCKYHTSKNNGENQNPTSNGPNIDLNVQFTKETDIAIEVFVFRAYVCSPLFYP